MTTRFTASAGCLTESPTGEYVRFEDFDAVAKGLRRAAGISPTGYAELADGIGTLLAKALYDQANDDDDGGEALEHVARRMHKRLYAALVDTCDVEVADVFTDRVVRWANTILEGTGISCVGVGKQTVAPPTTTEDGARAADLMKGFLAAVASRAKGP